MKRFTDKGGDLWYSETVKNQGKGSAGSNLVASFRAGGGAMKVSRDQSHSRGELELGFRVDGISLGDRRLQVDRRWGTPAEGSNPAWSRYMRVCGEWTFEAAEGLPILVCFQPAWPATEVSSWQVQTICGTTLSRGSEIVLRIGDSELTARAALGKPDEEFATEPGYSCLVFGECFLTIEGASRRVVEISLQKKVAPLDARGARLSSQVLLDGALAC